MATADGRRVHLSEILLGTVARRHQFETPDCVIDTVRFMPQYATFLCAHSEHRCDICSIVKIEATSKAKPTGGTLIPNFYLLQHGRGREGRGEEGKGREGKFRTPFRMQSYALGHEHVAMQT